MSGSLDAHTIILVILVLLSNLLCGGVIFGWVAMQSMLEEDGVYGSSCPDDDLRCPDRVSRFVLLFAIGSSVFLAGQFPAGLLVDRLGPVKCNVLTGVVTAGASALLAVSDDQGFDGLLPGAILLGFGGSLTLLGSIPLNSVVPAEYKILTITAVNSIFQMSPVSYLLVYNIYSITGMSRQAILGTYAAIGALVHIGLVVAWGCGKASPSQRLLDTKARERQAQELQEQEEGSQERAPAVAAQESQSTSVASAQFADKIVSEDPPRPPSSSEKPSMMLPAPTDETDFGYEAEVRWDTQVEEEDDEPGAAEAAALEEELRKPLPQKKLRADSETLRTEGTESVEIWEEQEGARLSSTISSSSSKAAGPDADGPKRAKSGAKSEVSGPTEPGPEQNVSTVSTNGSARASSIESGGIVHHHLPFRQQLCTFEFMFLAVFFTTQVYRHNLFVGTIRSVLDRYGDANIDFMYSQIFGASLFFSALFPPAITWYLKRVGFAKTFLTIMIVGVLWNLVALVDSLPLQLLGFALFLPFRVGLFTVHSVFLDYTFGARSSASVQGVISIIAASANLCIYPASVLAQQNAEQGGLSHLYIFLFVLGIPSGLLAVLLR